MSKPIWPSWERVDLMESLFRMKIERGWIYGTDDKGGAPIALVFVPDPKPGISQEAAEDLLEALKELVAEADAPVGWDGHPHKSTTGFQFARDAIKKAEAE